MRLHHAPLLDSISGDLNVTSCCFAKVVIKRILPYMGITMFIFSRKSIFLTIYGHILCDIYG